MPTPERIPATKISITIIKNRYSSNIDANIRFQINGDYLCQYLQTKNKWFKPKTSGATKHGTALTSRHSEDISKSSLSRPPYLSSEVRSRQTTSGNQTIPPSKNSTYCNCAVPVLPRRTQRPSPALHTLQVQQCSHYCNKRTDGNTERHRKSSLRNHHRC